MQASSLVFTNLAIKPQIPNQISAEFVSLLKNLEKKLKMTPDRKNKIEERFREYYLADTTTSITALLGVVLYQLFPFLTYQLICSWLEIKRTEFVRIQKKLSN